MRNRSSNPAGSLLASCLRSGSSPVVTMSVIFSARSSPMPAMSVRSLVPARTRSAIGSGKSRMVRAALRYARTRNGFASWISRRSATSSNRRAMSGFCIEDGRRRKKTVEDGRGQCRGRPLPSSTVLYRPCRPFVSVLLHPRPLRNHLSGGSVMTCGTLVRLSTLMVGAALVLLGSPAPVGAQGQATTGIIRGVVTDPNGAPVANATVILHEGQTNFTRTLTTDAAGNFTGTLLPLGTYDVTARSVGYAEVKRTGIALGVGETVALRLPLAAVTLAAVTVEATQPVVNVTQSAAATPLSAAAVTGLPNNGRNFINLTLLTPNVAIVQGPDGDELTVAGQRGTHNNVSVDGADLNNPFFGEQRGGQRPAFTFNLDAVQEVVVVEGPANAEFGRASAGFVNVITKSGTNETKGSLHYFGKFDAVSGSPEHTFPSGQVQKFSPDFSQNQFGFTLGGPLKRDRVFYFLAYDQQIYDDVKQK